MRQSAGRRWGPLVAPVLKQVHGELPLGVDDPDEQQAALRLQPPHWHVQKILVCQLIVAKRHPCPASRLPEPWLLCQPTGGGGGGACIELAM